MSLLEQKLKREKQKQTEINDYKLLYNSIINKPLLQYINEKVIEETLIRGDSFHLTYLSTKKTLNLFKENKIIELIKIQEYIEKKWEYSFDNTYRIRAIPKYDFLTQSFLIGYNILDCNLRDIIVKEFLNKNPDVYLKNETLILKDKND